MFPRYVILRGSRYYIINQYKEEEERRRERERGGGGRRRRTNLFAVREGSQLFFFPAGLRCRTPC